MFAKSNEKDKFLEKFGLVQQTGYIDLEEKQI